MKRRTPRTEQTPPLDPSSAHNLDLFPADSTSSATVSSPSAPTYLPGTPLAERMRPTALHEVVGQAHLLAEGGFLRHAVAHDRVPSLMLWGPPGTGKTTLAQVIARETRARFVTLSAVTSGVADIRKVVAEASTARQRMRQKTLLFVDEIHHFNKSQQDALLPHVELGTVTLIGATTENPSFAVNAALMSRSRVLRLEPLSLTDIEVLLRRALQEERGLGSLHLQAEDAALTSLARAARGDARSALTQLEATAEYCRGHDRQIIDQDAVRQSAADPTLLHDRQGEAHYDVVSAFIKSMRGSDPDAALYWMMRMLEAGEDPRFVLRRMMIFASEDIGTADPQALPMAVAADQAFHRLGLPEAMFALAQCCVYLSTAPKSNACYRAWTAARQDVRTHGALPVPLKLRNAPTAAMKQWGYGEGYRYPHDEVEGIAPNEDYLPEPLVQQRYFHPTERGYERELSERLAAWRSDASTNHDDET